MANRCDHDWARYGVGHACPDRVEQCVLCFATRTVNRGCGCAKCTARRCGERVERAQARRARALARAGRGA